MESNQVDHSFLDLVESDEWTNSKDEDDIVQSFSLKDALADLRVHELKEDAGLGRSHSSVAEELLEEIKEQLREEMEKSMEATRQDLMILKKSIQQAHSTESSGNASNREIFKLRSELSALRKQLGSQDSAEDAADSDFSKKTEASSNLSAMKAEFIKSMARKTLARDLSTSLRNEMHTVFEEDEESIEDDATQREEDGNDVVPSQPDEKSFLREDIEKLCSDLQERYMSPSVKTHQKRKLLCMKTTIETIDIDQYDPKENFIEWTTLKQEIENLKAELQMMGKTENRTNGHSEIADARPDLNFHVDVEPDKPVPETAVQPPSPNDVTMDSQIAEENVNLHCAFVIEQDPVEHEHIDGSIDKKGAFVRLLRTLSAPRGLKKTRTSLYMSLQPKEEVVSKSQKRVNAKTPKAPRMETEICILSPRRAPSKITPTKQEGAITLPPKSSVLSRKSSMVRTQSRGDGCVLVCLSPTANLQGPKQSHSSECPGSAATSMSSYSQEEEEDVQFLDEATISCKPLLTVMKSDQSISGKPSLRIKSTSSGNTEEAKRAVATEESIEVKQMTSSSSNILVIDTKEVEEIFADPRLSAFFTETGEVEAFKRQLSYDTSDRSVVIRWDTKESF